MGSCEAHAADLNHFGCIVWEEPAHPTVLPRVLGRPQVLKTSIPL